MKNEPKTKRGRKPMIDAEAMARIGLTLDKMTLRKLRVLGDGNVSAGVRKAADVAYDAYQSGKI
jgi:hypothetical protein